MINVNIDKTDFSLDTIRHSTAHLLAHAVKQLFPRAKLALGPVTGEGFYYDFALDRSFTEEDLELIEKRMLELIEQNIVIVRRELDIAQVVDIFKDLQETYKLEVIDLLVNSNRDNQGTLSVYQQADFLDLCQGPHVASTGLLKNFKLTKISGAYWRGDSNNLMLQRIYGTAFATKEELDAYLNMLSEMQKRDHRRLGKQLDLFYLSDEAPGMVFWRPHGWVMWQLIEQYIRSMYVKYGYKEVKTPQIVNSQLWQKSGHLDKFHNDMFCFSDSELTKSQLDNHEFVIKPMNCPCHILLYNAQGVVSYRELPVKLAEFGCCHRKEASGALHGIMRTRSFTQDDGHIICREIQITSEVMSFIDMLFEVYNKFGLYDVAIKLSTRPTLRIGDDVIWDKAEQALADALNSKGLDWQIMQGEGAFYGPKIEFEVKDCLQRSWTTGSIQLDFSMPARLGAYYIDEHGNKSTPVMLHRAICGSLERFIGILIEHYAGHFPLWIAPIQVVVLNISQAQVNYTNEVYRSLIQLGLRVTLDTSNQKISYKIREFTLKKIPYLIIIGNREQLEGKISIRKTDGTNLGSMSINQFFQNHVVGV